MLNDSSMYDETPTDKDSRSLVHLPSEILLYIIRMLPQSPYYKCLSVCKRLDGIENEYAVESSVMCICRLHKHSPNLPSRELKLLICWELSARHLNTFIGMIMRRPPTCRTTVYGADRNLDALKNYLKQHDDHPYVKAFVKNCKMIIDYDYDFPSYKFIDLCIKNSYNFQREFVTNALSICLGENHDFIKRFCNTLKGSCFDTVTIHCNNVNFLVFNDYLKSYWHISDILHFQTKVRYLYFDQVITMPFSSNLLSDFYNLSDVFLTINEKDLKNLKSRLSELAYALKQANLQNLGTFSLWENTSFEYVKDLMPVLVDLLYAIPSKKLARLKIGSTTVENFNECHASTQPESNDLSLAHGIGRFVFVEFLTIYHLGFDSTLLRILPYLCRLRNLDLRINMDMCNKNVIDELCYNLGKCQSLREIRLYVPQEIPIMFSNIFVSLTKIQGSITISLDFDSLESCPAYEWFENLRPMKNLRKICVFIDSRQFDGTIASSTTIQKLQEKVVQVVPTECEVYIQYQRYQLKHRFEPRLIRFH